MTDSRYAMSLDELEHGVRVTPERQVTEQTEPRVGPVDWCSDLHPYGDGMSAGIDGDGD